MLPDKTQASILKGVWFVHDDGINTIKIFGSNSGKERIYINDELVSEDRSVKLKNEHQFQDQSGNTYDVKFIVTKLLKGEMDCLIIRNGELIKSFHTKYNRRKIFSIKTFLLTLLCATAYVYISTRYEFPDWGLYVFMIFMTISIVALRKGEIEISEDKGST